MIYDAVLPKANRRNLISDIKFLHLTDLTARLHLGIVHSGTTHGDVFPLNLIEFMNNLCRLPN